MELADELKALGVDIEDATTRFMNNTLLYEKMLLKLPQVVDDAQVLPFIESGDYETALSNAHTLKGVMGNLSITPLYRCYTEVVNLLREGYTDSARELLEQNTELQKKIVECINNHS